MRRTSGNGGDGLQPVSLTSRSEGNEASRARLVVVLPAGARLYVDGRPVTVRSDEATFCTPALEPGADFSYTLRVEVEHNGRTIQESRKLVFRAGDDIRVSFLNLALASR